MVTPKKGSPRGRPPGPSEQNEVRDAFVHATMAGLMQDLSFDRDRASEVAKFLLAGCNDDPPRGLLRNTVLGPEPDWGLEREVFRVPDTSNVDGADASIHRWTRVWTWWETHVRWWMDHPIEARRPKLPIVLSTDRIRSVYETGQAADPAMRVRRFRCDNCGHVNESTPARGEALEVFDACRKCGVTLLPVTELR